MVRCPFYCVIEYKNDVIEYKNDDKMDYVYAFYEVHTK